MGMALPCGFRSRISVLTKVFRGVGKMDISTWVIFPFGEQFGVLAMGGNGTYLCFFMV